MRENIINQLEEIFGIKIGKNEIFVKIAFEIMLAKKNDKIILVEGSTDKIVYEKLFKREKKENYFFVVANGKNNIIQYKNFDNINTNLFAIIDRDFDENNYSDNIIVTRYASLEADILNCNDIDKVITQNSFLKEHKQHINSLEFLMQKVYKGEYIKYNIHNYKNNFFKLKSVEDMVQKELFIKKEKNKQYIGDGIHCAKYIFEILKKLFQTNYNNIIINFIAEINDDNPLIKNIVRNKIFLD